MNDRQVSLAAALKQLSRVLKPIGLRQMPRLVFDDFYDWIAVSAVLPRTDMPFENNVSGLRIELTADPADPVSLADRFVAQEIGA